MKQDTLRFATAKRTNSQVSSGKSQKGAQATAQGKSKRVVTPVKSRDDAEPSEALEISSDEEDALDISVPAKRTRASTKARPFPGTAKQAASQPLLSEKESHPVGIEREHLDIADRAGRYRKYYNEVRSKMGHLKPIHSESQNKIHQMLRFFDMSCEYGPCIGMTRLERWERAENLGLNPPVEVRDILLTKEGDEYVQCVLHGEV